MANLTPRDSAPRLRRLLYGLTNWGLFLAGIVNLGVGTWSALNSDAAIAATSLTAGLVLLFAATIDRFESLKGLGIEAKTRKLDEKIEQADEALRKLRRLAELTGGALIDMNSKMGRWGVVPRPRESLALAERVRTIMGALGSEPAAIAEALRPWARITCRDLVAAVTEPLNHLLREKVEELEQRRQHMRPGDPDYSSLAAQINAGSAYMNELLGKVYLWELDDYPESFLALFENVPYLTDDELSPFREKAKSFAADMNTLKRSMSLQNAEAWMRELEKAHLVA